MRVLSDTPKSKKRLCTEREFAGRLNVLTSPLGWIISLVVFLACPMTVAGLPNYRLAWPDPGPISAAVGSTGTTAAPIFYYQGTGVPPGGRTVFPDVITWSISDGPVAKLQNCTASSCTIFGLKPGNALLYADSHSDLLGLDQKQIKTIVITTTPPPSDGCTDQTARSVSCGGDCTAIGIRGSIQRAPSSELVAALFDPRVSARDEFGLISSPIAAAFRLMSAVSNSALSIPINLSCDPQGGTIEIITSNDPNDKAGSQGTGTQQYISGSTPLRYAILFSNLSTATAPAQDVIISDQLDVVNGDLTTLNIGPISFGAQLVRPPLGLTDYTTIVDLRPANDLLVKVNAHLDVSKGLLTWTLASLDPTTSLPPTDPTAGFLPPGIGGDVFFTVMPKTGVATNTQIQNQATITFDVNPPMSTQTWVNTIDNTPPTSNVAALATTEATPQFNVSWSGTDTGAGIQDFTIYVSDNGGPFTPFQTNTTATIATFTGQAGHTYGFYSISRDLVGNVEAAKSGAEATTQVTTDTTPPVTIAAVSPSPNAAGWNNSNVTVTLNSTDNEPGGTGVQQISYSSTGAQTITSTNVSGSSTSFTISAEGTTTIKFFGTDNAGNVETTKTLTIQLDKTPPTISGSRIPLPNANGWNNSSVTVSFQCADNLSGLAAGSPPAPTTLSTEGAGQSVSGTCTDIAGNSASATVGNINIDKTPPTVACSASPNVLWPPNNQLVPISVSVNVSDALSGPGGFTLVSVTSNEPDSGQGDIQGFATGTASTSGQLRATRLGSGTGRVYTFTYNGSDKAGNTASCTTTVIVPHDQGQN